MPTLLDVITIEDLSAFVDGQVDGDLAEAIEELDLEDDRCAEVLSAYIAQNALMHRSMDPMLSEPVPKKLIALLRNHVSRSN